MARMRGIAALIAISISVPVLAQQAGSPKADVADTYHGITVSDPYRWLENAADPKVVAWTAEQNARTRAVLDAVPSRPAIRGRLGTLVTRGGATYSAFRPRGDRV